MPTNKTTLKFHTLFLVVILLVSGACQEKPTSSSANQVLKPNIVLIFSDDHAWTDYGFMGHDLVNTPNLDQLAKEGVVFPRGYVPTAVCRPSLMTMVTGLYPHEHKITGNDPAGGHQHPRFPRELLLEHIDRLETLPEILTRHGYLSHQSGKWWEGDYKRGGFTHGMTKGERHGDDGLVIGREGMDSVFQFIDYAIGQQQPFYLWYAPFLPHTPHNPPARLLEKYSQLNLTEPVAKYYAMIEWLDETCGELIDFLDHKGLRKNTLIYYLCDNGWIQKPHENGFANGSKQSAMDGGLRTPIIFSWPGVLDPETRNDLISSVDLMPTILGAAGIETSIPMSGMNLWPHLISGSSISRNIIFGEGYGHDIIDKDLPEASLAYRWCIEGEWKLILCYDGLLEGWGQETHNDMRREPVRLYNLAEDPHERNNLYQEHPDMVNHLTSKIDNWYTLTHRKVLEAGK
ncbi:MAG: sulfatase [Cyclobacteriaceae bacterium]|nr:MAG: sulfatase [Cyclobacteriaceae bacterium]